MFDFNDLLIMMRDKESDRMIRNINCYLNAEALETVLESNGRSALCTSERLIYDNECICNLGGWSVIANKADGFSSKCRWCIDDKCVLFPRLVGLA